MRGSKYNDAMVVNLRVGLILAALLCFAGDLAHAQRPNPRDLKPVAGVPPAPFGVTEKPGNVTHYVNNQHESATDFNNPNGTPDRPRASIPSPLAAGDVVEVRGGPYEIRRGSWVGEGTRSAPAFIKGVSDPVIKGDRLVFGGTFFAVDGFIFDGISLVMENRTSHFALRHSTVRNWRSAGHSSALVPAGSDIVIYGNEIHNNGDPNLASEVDIHGIKVERGAERIWILLNHMHHNGGDSIQLGNATSLEPWPHHIYIAQNVIHEDRENGVDIKKARDVIVSGNLIYGYEARSSSSGEIIVTHDGAQWIWILNNGLGLARQGIVSSGADQYVVAGNVISGIKHHPDDATYDPASMYRAAGILTYNTTNSVHLNNTLWDTDAGISYAGGTAATEIVNNIIGPLSGASHQIAIGNSKALAASVISHNLIEGPVQLRMGGIKRGCDGAECRNEKVQVVQAPKDFHLTAGSPAIDAGMKHSIYETFERRYGLDIAVDLYGTPRPQGDGIDIGAAEAPAGTPAAPSQLRRQRSGAKPAPVPRKPAG
jgi:hypothetical protein